MLVENLKVRGVVSFELKDENGAIKQQGSENTVVDAGLAYIISRMKDATATAMSHMAVGTASTNSSDPQASTQTTLGAEIGASRTALTSTTIVTTTVAGDSVQYICTFNPGVGTGAITEAGIFNNSTGGTMLARTVFSVINKGALDTLTITWKVTIA